MSKVAACLIAYAKCVRAEVRLQNELAKHWPFGMDDPEQICLAAALYRRMHSVAAYRKVLDLDRHSFADLPCEPAREWYGTYGCFAPSPDGKVESASIVCEHGCDYVIAQNPSEAKDLLLKAEKAQSMGTDSNYYDDWLLTGFGLRKR